MLRLTIKGDAFQARAALDARHLLTIMAMDPRPASGITIAEVDAADLGKVLAWFVEPIAAKRGEGFPAGSLLHYQEIEGYSG
jgi:hypothetical protein